MYFWPFWFKNTPKSWFTAKVHFLEFVEWVMFSSCFGYVFIMIWLWFHHVLVMFSSWFGDVFIMFWWCFGVMFCICGVMSNLGMCGVMWSSLNVWCRTSEVKPSFDMKQHITQFMQWWLHRRHWNLNQNWLCSCEWIFHFLFHYIISSVIIFILLDEVMKRLKMKSITKRNYLLIWEIKNQII